MRTFLYHICNAYLKPVHFTDGEGSTTSERVQQIVLNVLRCISFLTIVLPLIARVVVHCTRPPLDLENVQNNHFENGLPPIQQKVDPVIEAEGEKVDLSVGEERIHGIKEIFDKEISDEEASAQVDSLIQGVMDQINIDTLIAIASAYGAHAPFDESSDNARELKRTNPHAHLVLSALAGTLSVWYDAYEKGSQDPFVWQVYSANYKTVLDKIRKWPYDFKYSFARGVLNALGGAGATEIVHGIWVGGMETTTCMPLPTVEGGPRIFEAGRPPVDLIIDCANDARTRSTYEAWQIGSGCEIVQVPLYSGGNKVTIDDVQLWRSDSSPQGMRATFDKVAAALREGQRVMFACRQGADRSANLLALFLEYLCHEPGEGTQERSNRRDRIIENIGKRRQIVNTDRKNIMTILGPAVVDPLEDL